MTRLLLCVVAAALLSGCRGNPATAGPTVFANCGPMPPKVKLCLDALPEIHTKLELSRCLQEDHAVQDAELEKMRKQFEACSGPVAPTATPAAPAAPKKRWQFWK